MLQGLALRLWWVFGGLEGSLLGGRLFVGGLAWGMVGVDCGWGGGMC